MSTPSKTTPNIFYLRNEYQGKNLDLNNPQEKLVAQGVVDWIEAMLERRKVFSCESTDMFYLNCESFYNAIGRKSRFSGSTYVSDGNLGHMRMALKCMKTKVYGN